MPERSGNLTFFMAELLPRGTTNLATLQLYYIGLALLEGKTSVIFVPAPGLDSIS
jgi:hypothetical protein